MWLKEGEKKQANVEGKALLSKEIIFFPAETAFLQ